MKSNKAFTLIELLVVVLIIGILTAIAVPNYKKAVWKTRATEIHTILSNLIKAQKIYYQEHGNYANTFDQLDISYLADKNEMTEIGNYLAFGDWGIYLSPTSGLHFWVLSRAGKYPFQFNAWLLENRIDCCDTQSDNNFCKEITGQKDPTYGTCYQYSRF